MAEKLQPAGPLLAEAFEVALLVVGFVAAPGVAHEPEAAGFLADLSGIIFRIIPSQARVIRGGTLLI